MTKCFVNESERLNVNQSVQRSYNKFAEGVFLLLVGDVQVFVVDSDGERYDDPVLVETDGPDQCPIIARQHVQLVLEAVRDVHHLVVAVGAHSPGTGALPELLLPAPPPGSARRSPQPPALARLSDSTAADTRLPSDLFMYAMS